ARGHGGDGGGDDPSRPPAGPIGTGCRGVGSWKATKGGDRDGGRKVNDKGTMIHIGPTAARWSNLAGELVREFQINTLTWHPTCASSDGLTSRAAYSQGLHRQQVLLKE
ncbi:hypothetical protein Tco_0690639, partial [Tanacetum coccineum]